MLMLVEHSVLAGWSEVLLGESSDWFFLPECNSGLWFNCFYISLIESPPQILNFLFVALSSTWLSRSFMLHGLRQGSSNILQPVTVKEIPLDSLNTDWIYGNNPIIQCVQTSFWLFVGTTELFLTTESSTRKTHYVQVDVIYSLSHGWVTLVGLNLLYSSYKSNQLINIRAL